MDNNRDKKTNQNEKEWVPLTNNQRNRRGLAQQQGKGIRKRSFTDRSPILSKNWKLFFQKDRGELISNDKGILNDKSRTNSSK